MDKYTNPDFLDELTALINKYKLHIACGTPDFLLARFMAENLESYANMREEMD